MRDTRVKNLLRIWRILLQDSPVRVSYLHDASCGIVYSVISEGGVCIGDIKKLHFSSAKGKGKSVLVCASKCRDAHARCEINNILNTRKVLYFHCGYVDRLCKRGRERHRSAELIV